MAKRVEWNKCRRALRDANIVLDSKDEKRVEALVNDGLDFRQAIRVTILEKDKEIIDLLKVARQEGADITPYVDTYDSVLTDRQTLLHKTAQNYVDERNRLGLLRETLKAENRAFLATMEFLKGLNFLIGPQLGAEQDVIQPGDTIVTDDGMTFNVIEGNRITDGDLLWDSFLEFSDEMATGGPRPVGWRVERRMPYGELDPMELRGEKLRLSSDEHLLALFEAMLFQDRIRKQGNRGSLLEQHGLGGRTPQEILEVFRGRQKVLTDKLREISDITVRLSEMESRWRTFTDREWRNPNFESLNDDGTYVIEPEGPEGVAEEVVDYIVRGFRGQHGKPDERLIQTRLPTIVFTPEPDTANLYAQHPNNRADFAEAPRVVIADLEMKKPIKTDDIDPFFDLSDLVEAVGLDAVLELAEDGKFEDAVMGTNNFDEYRRNNFPQIMEEDGQTTYPREDFDELSLREILEQHPDSIDQLYGEAWVALQNEKFVQALKDAGYDSAVVGGTGENAGEVEYHVFDEKQILKPGVREDIINYSVTYVSQFPWEIKSSGEGDLYISRHGKNAGTPHRERQGPNDFAISFNRDVLLPEYMFYLLQFLQPQIAARARGTAQQAIRKGDIHDVILAHFENQAKEPSPTKQPAQGDLFGNEELSPDPADRVSESRANYKALVDIVEDKTLPVGITHVKNADDAAHILASIRKNAQEGVWGIVLDSEDRVLGVIEHSKGGPTGASVFPSVFAGHALQVPGAAKLWMGHNHPSGDPKPSDADSIITRNVEKILRGSEITIQGHIVVASGRSDFVQMDSVGDVQRRNAGTGSVYRDIRPAPRNKTVPVYTRRFKASRDPNLVVVNSPKGAKKVARQAAKEVGEGIIFLDNRHRPVGILKMSADEMRLLRGTGQLDKILRAQVELNAAAMIPFTNSKDTDASSNLAMFSQQGDLRMPDFLFMENGDYRSLASTGELNTGGLKTFNQDLVGMTSGLLEAAKNIKQEKGSAEQMIAQFYKTKEVTIKKGPDKGKKQTMWIGAPGVKKEEMDWLELEDYIRAVGEEQGFVTKEQIVDFIDKNGVVVEERWLGDQVGSRGQDDIPVNFEWFDEYDADEQAHLAHVSGLEFNELDLDSERDVGVWQSSVQVDAVSGNYDGPTEFMFTTVYDRQWQNVTVIDDDTGQVIPIFDPINGQDLASARAAITHYVRSIINRGSPVEAQETLYEGPAEATEWTMEGGFNHREVIFRLPHPHKQQQQATVSGQITVPDNVAEEAARDFIDEIITFIHRDNRTAPYVEEADWGAVGNQIIEFNNVPAPFWEAIDEYMGLQRYLDAGIQVDEFGRSGGDTLEDFTGHHAFTQWTNVLLWMRMSEHWDKDDNLILVIEEIQSDWHQKGRKYNYRPSGEDEQQVARRRLRQAESLLLSAQRDVDPIFERIMEVLHPEPDWMETELGLPPLDEETARAQRESRISDIRSIVANNDDWVDLLETRVPRDPDSYTLVHKIDDPGIEEDLPPGVAMFSNVLTWANKFGEGEGTLIRTPRNPYVIDADQAGWAPVGFDQEEIDSLKAEGYDGVLWRGRRPDMPNEFQSVFMLFDEATQTRSPDQAIEDQEQKVQASLTAGDIEAVNEWKKWKTNYDHRFDEFQTVGWNDQRVLDAPFKGTAWAELALKRAVRFAADEGYDKLVWTPGQVQKERYPGLVEYVDSVTYNPNSHRMEATPLVGDRPVTESIPPERLKDYLGEEPAERLLDEVRKVDQQYEIVAAEEAGVLNRDVANHISPDFLNAYDDNAGVWRDSPARGFVIIDQNGEIVRDLFDPTSLVWAWSVEEIESLKWSYIEDTDQMPSIQDDDLEIGGQGMDEFYDRILPKLARSVVKKLDKKAEVKKWGHRIVIDSPHTPSGRGYEYYVKEFRYQSGYGSPSVRIEYGVVRTIEGMRDDPQAATTLVSDMYETRQEAEEKLPIWTEGYPMHGFEMTEYIKESAKKGQTLFQDRRRGSISFDEQNKATVRMTRARDMSTFLHEGGHLFLELMGDLAEMGGASDQAKADFGKVLKFLGVEHREQIRRDHHEKFARAFEAYLREGKSPDPGLRDIFLAFKSWLMQIYKQLRKLDVELTDDIRGVFDRLIATDVAIKQSRQVQNFVELFTSAEDMGISPEAFEVYRRHATKAHEDALEREQRAVLEAMAREEQAWWKDERKKVEEEVRQEAYAMRVYRALSLLQRGKLPDGTEPETSTYKLDKDSLLRLLKGSKETLKRLPGKGKNLVYRVTGGVDVNIAAREFGYADATTMITEMLRAKPIEEFIQAETDARMAERFPDPLVSGELQERALDAVHNDPQARILAAEMRALRKKIQEDKKILGAERRADRRRQQEQKAKLPKKGEVALIKQAAKEVISRMKIRDVKPHLYLNAARKAGRKAFEAMERKDYEAAYRYKRQQLVNHEMYREAQRAKEGADKARAYLTRFERKPTRQRMGKAGVLERIDALLEGISLRKVTLKEVDRRTAMTSLLEAIEAGAVVAPPEVVDRLQNYGVNYQDLTVLEFMGIRDIVRQLEKMGKAHYEAVVNGEKVIIQEVVDELVEAVEATGQQVDVGVGQKRKKQKRHETVEAAVSAILRPGAIARVLDGSDWGAFTRKIIAPIRRAYSEKMLPWFHKSSEDVVKIYTDHYNDAELKRLNSELIWVESLGESLTKGELLSIALNMGSETNLRALRDGRKLNGDQAYPEAALRQVRGMLTERDWRFVQAVWDYLDSYWDDLKDDQGNVIRPGVKSTEQRRRGIAPDKVEPLAFTVRTSDGQEVEVRGGYYPLVYDSRHSKRQKIQEFENVLEKMGNGVYVSSNTRASATYNRTRNGGKVVRLGLNTIDLHLREILRDIAIGDEVNFVKRVLEHPELDAAMEKTQNQAMLSQLKMWLDDSAVGELPASGFYEKALAYTRTGFTKAKIGWNLVTMLLQTTGIFQTAAEMGTANYLKGLGKMMQNPAATWRFIMERSAFMKHRYDMGAWDKDVADARDHLQVHMDWLLGEGPTKARRISNRMARTLFAPIMIFQSQVDASTWMAGFIKGRNEGMSENEAVIYADARVEAAQTSGFFSDRSGIERGSVNYKTVQSQFVRIWTTLISYMLAKWGIAYEKTQGLKRARREGEFTFGTAIKFASDMILLFTIEGIASAIIYGNLPDDDDDEPFAWWLAKVSADSALSGVPFARETLNAKYGGGNTVVGGLTKDIYTVYQQALQGEIDEPLIKSINNVGGTLLHYPSSQTNRLIESAWAAAEGEDVDLHEYLFGLDED